MIFVKTERGGKIPLDEEPYVGEDNHQYVLRTDDAGHLVAMAVPPLVFDDEPHYRSHFRTCTKPDEHSRRRSA